jgi:pimeloyl-ACP methyl ester carboxylesterase
VGDSNIERAYAGCGTKRMWKQSLHQLLNIEWRTRMYGTNISECFESFLPAEGIEFIYYDQLGCGNSDNPEDYFLLEVGTLRGRSLKAVRKALDLNKDNFYLLGHSWGGISGIGGMRLKYQDNLKGLIISNMMCNLYSLWTICQRML